MTARHVSTTACHAGVTACHSGVMGRYVSVMLHHAPGHVLAVGHAVGCSVPTAPLTHSWGHGLMIVGHSHVTLVDFRYPGDTDHSPSPLVPSP